MVSIGPADIVHVRFGARRWAFSPAALSKDTEGFIEGSETDFAESSASKVQVQIGDETYSGEGELHICCTGSYFPVLLASSQRDF